VSVLDVSIIQCLFRTSASYSACSGRQHRTVPVQDVSIVQCLFRTSASYSACSERQHHTVPVQDVSIIQCLFRTSASYSACSGRQHRIVAGVTVQCPGDDTNRQTASTSQSIAHVPHPVCVSVVPMELISTRSTRFIVVMLRAALPTLRGHHAGKGSGNVPD
jgi:hypothetical protein